MTIRNIADAVDNRINPVISVAWDCGHSGHWLLVIGSQGYQGNAEDELQVTHLRCLGPTSVAPGV